MYYGRNNQDGSATRLFDTVDEVKAHIQDELEGWLPEWSCYDAMNHEVRFECGHTFPADMALDSTDGVFWCETEAAWPDFGCSEHNEMEN